MPGDVKTGFTDARKKQPPGEAYKDAAERSVATMERDERNGMPPEKIAKTVRSSAVKKRPRRIRTVGFRYHAVCALLKLLPVSVSNRIIGNIYSK